MLFSYSIKIFGKKHTHSTMLMAHSREEALNDLVERMQTSSGLRKLIDSAVRMEIVSNERS